MDDNVREALTKSGSVIDITTTGRKTGEPRRIEIVFHSFGGKVYISGYLKNDVKADLAATARSITDEAERLPILEEVKSSQTTWDEVSLEDALKMSPLVEVTFKD